MCRSHISRRIVGFQGQLHFFPYGLRSNQKTSPIKGLSWKRHLSVHIAGCFLNYMEEKVVVPENPLFYVRYVDDKYVRRKKNKNDILFNALNSLHKNIKLTVEVNPTKFLDTQISRYPDGSLSFKVVQEERKLPIHWTSEIPKKYKRNLIKGDLHRATGSGLTLNWKGVRYVKNINVLVFLTGYFVVCKYRKRNV